MSSITHRFQVRRGYTTPIELPEDFTQAEAERFARWVRTLPVEGSGDPATDSGTDLPAPVEYVVTSVTPRTREENDRLRLEAFARGASDMERHLTIPDCTGPGTCHGSLVSCSVCGDVFIVCDDRACMQHPYAIEQYPEGWRLRRKSDTEFMIGIFDDRSDAEELYRGLLNSEYDTGTCEEGSVGEALAELVFAPGPREVLRAGEELPPLQNGEVRNYVMVMDIDPTLCERRLASCFNCGRGLAHDDACPPLEDEEPGEAVVLEANLEELELDTDVDTDAGACCVTEGLHMLCVVAGEAMEAAANDEYRHRVLRQPPFPRCNSERKDTTFGGRPLKCTRPIGHKGNHFDDTRPNGNDVFWGDPTPPMITGTVVIDTTPVCGDDMDGNPNMKALRFSCTRPLGHAGDHTVEHLDPAPSWSGIDHG